MSDAILSQKFIDSYKERKVPWGFNGLGYIIFRRTYSRLLESGKYEDWHETVGRCVNGAQAIGAGYTKDEAERLYDHVFNLRCNFAGRMLWQLGTPMVEKYWANSLVNCLAGETEVVTGNGVRQMGELAGSNVILMTTYGKWVNADIKTFGIQRLWKIELSKGKAHKVIFATEGHRWYRHRRRSGCERSQFGKVESTTSQLTPGDHLVSTHGQSVKSIYGPSLYGIAHGLIFGDGSVCNNIGQIRLCGSKNAELIQYFPNLKTYDYEGDKIVVGLPKYFKERPRLDMDKPYLYGWLAGYFAADGSVHENGSVRLASASRSNLEFARDVCIKLGIGYCTITKQDRIGIGQTEPSALYSLSINGADLTEDFFLISEHRRRFKEHRYANKLDWMVVSVSGTDRIEPVYCAVVPETHAFVLEGNILTGNCWFREIKDRQAFLFLFDNLMLGGGVGFSVRREDVHELPRIKPGVKITHLKTNDADFIVPDSRQGWVKLLEHVLDAFYTTGKSFTYSTILVRGAGEKIRGFGGTSSGPGILVDGIDKIAKIFQTREDKKLRSIDALDVCNIIGSIVVSGNVRRSAQIAMGDPDDYLFIRAKNWSLGSVPNWRAMSNNTIYADAYDHISSEIWGNGYELDPATNQAKGEPYGFFNLPLSQKYGRLKDGPLKDSKLYPTDKDNCSGGNPCNEISLSSSEACNLSELYLNNIRSKEELIDCATLLYKTQKAVCSMRYLHEESNDIVHKNMRLGLGVTGVCQSLDKLEWLDEAYLALRRLDRAWSKERGWPESIKLTTVKPSGSLSLLAGSTPGVHPAMYPYYIRRVRIGSDDKLVKPLRDSGYKIEFQKNFDGTEDKNTVVVEFPCATPAGAVVAKDMNILAQLELVKKLQTVWSDNAVSVTAYYSPEELPALKDWLKTNYEDSIKSVSFLLRDLHGFQQAPYQEITKEVYDETATKIKPISQIESGDVLDVECASGTCPTR